MEQIEIVKTHDFISGEGEMAKRIRNFEWRKTPLGPLENWSSSLKNVVSIMLANRFPMILWWGAEYIQLYNDAYIPVTGLKHPQKIFAVPGREGWAEIWDVIGPLVDMPFQGGPATWADDILLKLNRNNFTEETHFIIAYSPVPDSTAPNGIGGVLATVHEITEEVVGKRQMETLKELGKGITTILSESEVYIRAAEVLADNPYDIPFALVYKIEAEGTIASLVATAGIDERNDNLIGRINLQNLDPLSINLGLAITENKIIKSSNASTIGDLPAGAWDISPLSVVHVPIKAANRKFPFAILIIGLNPYRKFDDAYKNFITLISDQVSLGVNNAIAYEEERKRAEALQRLDKAKTIFFSNISHEFRTPLTLMLGTIEEALTDSNTDLPNKERMNVAHRNAMRLLRLVNTLLDFSRIESGRQKANYTPTDLSSLTKSLAGNFRSVMEKAGLKLFVDADSIMKPVYVDNAMWEKIVFNLLSNAFKYKLDGTITVRLFEENNQAILQIADTGIGIPDKELLRIFERFHRVENVAARTYEGTGIGLSLTKELVQLHGGSISASSQLGKGTSFTVAIPFGKEHLPATQISEVATSLDDFPVDGFIEEAQSMIDATVEIMPVGSEPDRPTVLVADDNGDMRQHIRSILQKQFNVITAVNGLDALHKTLSEKPSLVLTDVMMPVMDGIRLLKEIRNDKSIARTPVVLLTARAGEESKIEGFETGADDYLVKPFSTNELVSRIKAQIEISQKRNDAELRLREFLIQAPAAIAVFEGPDHSITIANQQFQQVFDRKENQLIGHSVKEAFPEAGGQGIFELLDNVFESGRSYSQQGFGANLNISNKSERRYYDFTLQPITNSNVRTTGIMLHAVDVTERVMARKKMEDLSAELEQKVKERTGELQVKNIELGRSLVKLELLYNELSEQKQKDEQKDDFILMASHELKTPLTTISGYVQLLMDIRRAMNEGDGMDLPLFDSALKTIHKQLANLTGLVSELLDLSKIEKGQLEFHKTHFDLSELVRDVITDVQYTTQHKINLSIESNDNVFADKDRIMQVVLNFITNAIKYSPQANVIDINVSRYKEKYASVSIRDYGIGIDKADHEKIFERFYRAKGHKEKTFPGFGIGLFIASDIIRRHDGSVSVKSEIDDGAEFTFMLPIDISLPEA